MTIIELKLSTAIKEAGDIEDVRLMKEDAEYILGLLKKADDALNLLKEQEEQIKNRDESLEKAREEIKWLRGMLKEQETSNTGKARIFQCEKCGYGFADIFLTDEHNYDIEPNYCPNCGRLVK